MTIAMEWLNDDNLTISDTVEAIYSNPAATVSVINGIVLHNTNAGSIEVTLHLCPAGAAAADGNEIYKQTLLSDETVTLPDLRIIMHTATDVIRAKGGTADVVNIFIFGEKKT